MALELYGRWPSGSRFKPAEPNADHRPLYLDYEGPVAGGRGTVSRWDAGTFDWVEDGPGRVVVELRGARLAGRFALTAGSDGWAVSPAAGSG